MAGPTCYSAGMISQIPFDAQFFEAVMMVCFGASWPVAILKTLRTRCVAGKSLGFLVLIFIGYAAGVAAKYIFAASNHVPVSWVTLLYGINGAMVLFDIGLYLRFASRRPQEG